jgi:hypothetical protein
MKKLAFSLIACLAFVQSTYAATSALTESLLEYEAITSAIGTDPNFENIISPVEFIVDIKRITRKVNITGIVKYRIVTRVICSTAGINASEIQEEYSSGNPKHKHCHDSTNIYVATLNVSPNPGIGPNIVTVLSIKKVRSSKKSSTFFNDDFPDTTIESN